MYTRVTMENLAAVLYGKKDLRLENRPIAEPGHGEVSVAMLHVGMCGSDTYSYSWGKYGDSVVTEPAVFGHEGSARVTKVGDGVKTLKVGDRVALEPGTRCLNCKRCKQGRPNTCVVDRPWSASFEGMLMRNKTLPETACHRLPETVGDEDGSFMEPLAVAVHVCRRAQLQPGKSVLVLGAGCIGQLCLMSAMAMGVTNICITDVLQGRLAIAQKLGAPVTYLTESRDKEIVCSELVELLGEEPDVTLECSGNAWCQGLAIKATSPGGTVMFVGLSNAVVELPLATAAQKEVDMKTIYRYDRECFAIAIELVARGKVKLSPLISHRYPLEKTLEALQLACDRDPGVMKVIVNCQKK